MNDFREKQENRPKSEKITTSDIRWENIWQEFKKSPNGDWAKEFYTWIKKTYEPPLIKKSTNV